MEKQRGERVRREEEKREGLRRESIMVLKKVENSETLSISLAIYLSIYLSVYLFIWPSNYVFVSLFHSSYLAI